MNAFHPIDPAHAEGHAKTLLDAVKAKLGVIPNMTRVMADGEIGEIVANVALNIFTNYFNNVTAPIVDFPVAKPRALAKAA